MIGFSAFPNAKGNWTGSSISISTTNFLHEYCVYNAENTSNPKHVEMVVDNTYYITLDMDFRGTSIDNKTSTSSGGNYYTTYGSSINGGNTYRELICSIMYRTDFQPKMNSNEPVHIYVHVIEE